MNITFILSTRWRSAKTGGPRESAAASGHASALALGARWERASAAALEICWARASAAASALVWDSGSAEVLDVASELALHY